MGVPQASDDTLIRYVEADLPPHETGVVEAILATDPEARRKVEMLRRTAYVLRETIGRLTEDDHGVVGDFDSTWPPRAGADPPEPRTIGLAAPPDMYEVKMQAPDFSRLEKVTSHDSVAEQRLLAPAQLSVGTRAQFGRTESFSVASLHHRPKGRRWPIIVGALILGVLVGAAASYLLLRGL